MQKKYKIVYRTRESGDIKEIFIDHVSYELDAINYLLKHLYHIVGENLDYILFVSEQLAEAIWKEDLYRHN